MGEQHNNHIKFNWNNTRNIIITFNDFIRLLSCMEIIDVFPHIRVYCWKLLNGYMCQQFSFLVTKDIVSVDWKGHNWSVFYLRRFVPQYVSTLHRFLLLLKFSSFSSDKKGLGMFTGPHTLKITQLPLTQLSKWGHHYNMIKIKIYFQPETYFSLGIFFQWFSMFLWFVWYIHYKITLVKHTM